MLRDGLKFKKVRKIMSEYPNSGALWRSKDRPSEKHPYMHGKLELGADVIKYLASLPAGKDAEIEMSAWNKKTQKGDTFLSIRVQIPYAERQQSNQRGPADVPKNHQSDVADDFSDDIPF